MLSKTAEYALRAAVCLAQSPQACLSGHVLATMTKIPRRYLHKVVQDLVAANLVRSQPGPGGGYALAKSIDEVSILDVVNAVSPVQRIAHCPLGLTSHTTLCPLHQQLDDVYASTQAALKAVSLGQVTRSTSHILPLCEVSVERKKPATSTKSKPRASRSGDIKNKKKQK